MLCRVSQIETKTHFQSRTTQKELSSFFRFDWCSWFDEASIIWFGNFVRWPSFELKDWGQSLFSRCLDWNHEVEIIFCHLAKIGRGDKIGRDWETRVQIHFVVKWQPFFVNRSGLTWQWRWSVAFLNSLVELQKTWPISLKWLLSKAILR